MTLDIILDALERNVYFYKLSVEVFVYFLIVGDIWF